MDRVTIEQILDDIRQHLHVSKEVENDLLSEIRTHLEDAMAEAAANGEDDQAALRKAAEHFGVEEVGVELQREHSEWESIDAIIVTALPVLFALILRWLVFAPEGSALNWPQLLSGPGFWIVAASALILPVLFLRRWRFALIGWGLYWLLTVIFVIFPTVHHW